MPKHSNRTDIEETTGRLMVVAEMKILVRKLDDYLEMINEWESEEGVPNA